MKNLSSLYVLNGIAFLMSIYIIFVVFISIIKGIQNSQLQPVWTYGIGYVLILLILYWDPFINGTMNRRNKDHRKNSIITSV